MKVNRSDTYEWNKFEDRLQKYAFWCAIILPLVYIPLLFFGIDTFFKGIVFTIFVIINVAMVIIGHSHNQD